MRLTRPKRGKDEFDHDSKCVIYQKFLESRGKAFDGGRGEKISMLFLYESLLSKETTLKVCRLSVYLRHGRHLSCLWIMYANLQAGITRRN